MNHKYWIILTLSICAVVLLAASLPEYIASVQELAATGDPTAGGAPPEMMVASLIGIVAWVWTVLLQWKEGETLWILATVVLSYAAIIAYCALRLNAGRTPVGLPRTAS